VSVRGEAVLRDIKDEHEGSFHELGGRDLDAGVSVVYTETAKFRLIGYRSCHCICYDKRALAALYVHHKVIEMEVPEVIRVAFRRSREIDISEHREEQMFRQVSQHVVVYGHGFRPRPEVEVLRATSVISYLAFTFCKDLA
jgi:hypothetical protein